LFHVDEQKFQNLCRRTSGLGWQCDLARVEAQGFTKPYWRTRQEINLLDTAAVQIFHEIKA